MFGVLVFISLASDSDSDLSGNVSDAINPDKSVKASIDTDIFSKHLFSSEALDISNATRGSLLELNAV